MVKKDNVIIILLIGFILFLTIFNLNLENKQKEYLDSRMEEVVFKFAEEFSDLYDFLDFDERYNLENNYYYCKVIEYYCKKMKNEDLKEYVKSQEFQIQMYSTNKTQLPKIKEKVKNIVDYLENDFGEPDIGIYNFLD